MLSKELLEILVCPACKGPLRLNDPIAGEDAQAWLVCEKCAKRYPVREDIPIMLIEEAQPLRAMA